MKLSSLDWRYGVAAAAGLVVAGSVMALRWLNCPPDPEQIEHQRRSHLNRIGRIAEGRVVELLEVAASSGSEPVPAAKSKPQVALLADAAAQIEGKRHVVCYSYSISGVSYETAQDVTGIGSVVSLDRFTAGQSASVKYDPANPSNSILIADNWSGLS